MTDSKNLISNSEGQSLDLISGSNPPSTSLYYLYTESGFRVMRLHGVNDDGTCECGNPECLAILKHPFSTNWQNTPLWDDEQLETMDEFGWLNNFGVLIDDHLVIDIDPRNGGMESYHKLVEDTGIDFMSESGFVVETGGGGWHIYFKDETGLAYKSTLQQYPGIDFKTNGFVVGAGSMHKSGMRYKIDKGDPADLTNIPDGLIEILRKPEHHRGVIGAHEYDITNNELERMLGFIDNTVSNGDNPSGLDYDTWIMVGMSLHHTTSGSMDGYKLWDDWSGRSGKYNPTGMNSKWLSFGKSSNPVTLGSLYHLAEQGGYLAPVTFNMPETYNEEVENEIKDKLSQKTPPRAKRNADEETPAPICPVNVKDFAITSPPRNTLVKELSDHLKKNLRRKRNHLATMAALSVIGNLAGLRFTDEAGTTTNAFWFGVGDSGTGKDGIIGKCQEIYDRLGLGEAVAGAIKSEQEIVRNFIYSQANWYLIDEMGKFLKKLKNAEEKGATSYLENVVSILMNAYSKANSHLGISGDLKRQLINENNKRIKDIKKKISEGFEADIYIDNAGNEQKISIAEQELSAQKALAQYVKSGAYLKMGIYRPFLSLTGLSTSTGFDEFFTKETIMDGFMGRMIIFRENETAPLLRKDYRGEPLPDKLFGALSNLFYGSTAIIGSDERIERYQDRQVIRSTTDATKLMMELTDYFDDLAYYYSCTNGFQALALRGMEAVRKISLILAAPSGLREIEHVQYAVAVVMHDIKSKINMVTHSEGKDSKDKLVRSNALLARVIEIATGDPMSRSQIIQRSQSRHFNKEDCTAAFEHLVKTGELVAISNEGEQKTAGRPSLKYIVK